MTLHQSENKSRGYLQYQSKTFNNVILSFQVFLVQLQIISTFLLLNAAKLYLHVGSTQYHLKTLIPASHNKMYCILTACSYIFAAYTLATCIALQVGPKLCFFFHIKASRLGSRDKRGTACQCLLQLQTLNAPLIYNTLL